MDPGADDVLDRPAGLTDNEHIPRYNEGDKVNADYAETMIMEFARGGLR